MTVKSCSCKVIIHKDDNQVIGHAIKRCALHEAAPKLYDMLKTVHREGAGIHYEAIAELLAKSEGK